MPIIGLPSYLNLLQPGFPAHDGIQPGNERDNGHQEAGTRRASQRTNAPYAPPTPPKNIYQKWAPLLVDGIGHFRPYKLDLGGPEEGQFEGSKRILKTGQFYVYALGPLGPVQMATRCAEAPWLESNVRETIYEESN